MSTKQQKPITLLMGDDEYLIDSRVQDIVSTLQQTIPSIELETIDGMVSSVSEADTAIRRCKSSLQSPGLFSADRLVWLKNAAFLDDSRTASSDTILEALGGLAEFLQKGLPDGFTFLITAETVDKRRAFYKALLKLATIQEFNRPKNGSDRSALVRAILQKHGCEMSPDLIQVLADRVGSDTRRLVVETEKLCLYVLPEKRVSPKDIETIVSTTTETAFYELANRFGEFDLPGAIRTLHELLFQKHSVMGLMAHLENTIRDMLIFREALDQGWLQKSGRLTWQAVPPEVEQALSSLDRDPRKLPPFIASRLAENTARFTRKRLDHCLKQTVLAHEKMVSSRVPPELILEVLLVRMLGKAKRRTTPSK